MCTADRSLCTDDVCTDGLCAHPLRAGTVCDDQGLCTCDDDGLFCAGPVRCPLGGGLCTQLPPPCGEDDTCDEEHDVCVSPFGTATATATSSPTATAVTPGAPTPTATAIAQICGGDCNGDRMVAINELILGANVALGSRPLSACTAFDRNRNGSVEISELITGVGNALNGCRL